MLLTTNRAEIKSLYDKLHRANITHGDFAMRNVTRGDDGQIRLIDFDRSIIEAAGADWRERERAGVARATGF